jgi:type IV secretory pathway VirB10-like protein
VHQILLLSREIAMQMPSLFKYFLTVGGALLGVLFLANYLLDQPAPATAQNAAATRSVAVKTDPQASRMERWRAEQAAAEAARKEDAARLAAQPAEPETTAAQPVKAAATSVAATQTADASLNGTETPAAEQSKAKSQKARAEKARSKRLAREDARINPRERTASNQQDDYYYGQRQAYGQQGYAQQGYGQRPMFAPAPTYAYAPQQSYGPFGGGWGRGW